MRLVVYCKKCSKRNLLNIKATDRIALRMRYGNVIERTCKECSAKNKYEISDIKAEQRFGRLISFIVVVFLMVLTICFLWDYAMHQMSSPYLLPVGLFIVLLFYIVITKEMNNNLRNFNRS